MKNDFKVIKKLFIDYGITHSKIHQPSTQDLLLEIETVAIPQENLYIDVQKIQDK